MESQPGKFQEVQLGLRSFREACGQAGLRNHSRAVAFGDNVKRRTEVVVTPVFPFRWREQPYQAHSFLRQRPELGRQALPHLRFGLERPGDDQFPPVALHPGVR